MMRRLDFECQIKQTISDEEYEIIDYVYTHHPSFRDKSNHENINRMAQLYKEFGMSLIKSMVYVANQINKLDTKIQILELELDRYKREKAKLENGEFEVYINKGE